MAIEDQANWETGPVKLTLGGTNVGFTEGEGRLVITRDQRDQTCAEYGSTPLNRVVTGHQVVFTCTVKEPVVANIKFALPEGHDGSTYIGIGGNIGQRLGDSAVEAILHPRAIAAGTTTQDITIHKAIVTGPLELPFSWDTDRVFELQISGLLDATRGVGDKIAKLAAST